MRDGFRLYDTHTHLGRARHSGARRDVDQALRAMDANGVDRAVLIPFPVVESYREAHDEIGRAVTRHPDRFTGAACIDPFIPEREYRDEVQRCAESWGFRALKFQPQYQGLNPVSERSDFLFESALENDLVVIAHTGAGAPFALPSLFIAPARRFPKLKIVLGHAGGAQYFLETIVAADVCDNLYVELSSLMPHHILAVLDKVAPERLMVGSDLDASMPTEMSKVLTLAIDDAAKRRILWETPRRLFDDAV